MDIQVFSKPEFGEIRVGSRTSGEPWFAAVDICKALQIKNSREATSRLDDDEKGVVLTDTLGGAQLLSTVNESGLYALVLGSRKKEAKDFKRWVTHDVLPSIRQNGAYIAGQETMSELELLARATIASRRIIESRDNTISKLAPKAASFDALTMGENDMDFNTFSKYLQQSGVDIGHVLFMKRLRQDGLLMRNSQQDNIPTQRAKNLGIFSMRLTEVRRADGRVTTSTTTRITPKGKRYLFQKYASNTASETLSLMNGIG